MEPTQDIIARGTPENTEGREMNCMHVLTSRGSVLIPYDSNERLAHNLKLAQHADSSNPVVERRPWLLNFPLGQTLAHNVDGNFWNPTLQTCKASNQEWVAEKDKDRVLGSSVGQVVVVTSPAEEWTSTADEIGLKDGVTFEQTPLGRSLRELLEENSFCSGLGQEANEDIHWRLELRSDQWSNESEDGVQELGFGKKMLLINTENKPRLMLVLKDKKGEWGLIPYTVGWDLDEHQMVRNMVAEIYEAITRNARVWILILMLILQIFFPNFKYLLGCLSMAIIAFIAFAITVATLGFVLEMSQHLLGI